MRSLLLLVVALLVVAVSLPAAAAPDLLAPMFVANNLTTAKVKVFVTSPGDNPFTWFHCYAGSSDAQFAFRSGKSGAVKKLRPIFGFTAADSTILIPAGESKMFRFNSPYPDWVTVTTASTDAHVWAE